jgi:His/Glu/Gln/Arg/opine family amino acid ABC transporter permease subunit
MINIELISKSLPQFICGTEMTLTIAAFSGLIGIIVGTILGFMQTSENIALRTIAKTYATIIRGIPMLIQIMFVRYALLPGLNITVSALCAAIIAIGINSSAYVSQIIRSGIQAVGRGQTEAAQVLGMSPWLIKRYIIFPQALRIVLPALGNEFITLIKDSSLASVIGVMELFKEGKNIINSGYDAISIYIAIGVIYLILTSTLSFYVNALERKMNRHVAH